jgi:transposase-like protein
MIKMPRIRQEPNRSWSKDEKIRIINRHLIDGLSTGKVAEEEDISAGMLRNWIRKYLEYGEDALINKKRQGNPLAKYSNKKKLTKEEQLEYENMKLRIENELLKKGYLMKGDGTIVKFTK